MIKDAHGDPGDDPRSAGVLVVDMPMTALEEQLLALDEELAVQARRGLQPEEWPETRAAAVASSRPGTAGGDVVVVAEAVATERVIAVPPRVHVDPSAVDVSDPVARDLAGSAPGAACWTTSSASPCSTSRAALTSCPTRCWWRSPLRATA